MVRKLNSAFPYSFPCVFSPLYACSNSFQKFAALFYFGGHGFKDENSLHLYMMGCDANIYEPKDHVIDELYVLDEVLKQRPLFFISILDMCQTPCAS